MILPIAVVAALLALTDDGCPKKQDVVGPKNPPAVFTPAAPGRAEATFSFQLKDDDEDEPEVKDPKARARAEKDKREAEAQIRVEWRAHQTELREAMRQAQKEMDKVGTARQYLTGPMFGSGFANAFVEFGGPEPRVTLEIENLPIRDAIQKVFKSTKYQVSFDDAVPADVRVTVKVPNVRLSTALDMITDAGNVKWTRDLRFSADSTAPTVQYRIRKAVAPDHMVFVKPKTEGLPPEIVQIGPGSKLLDTGTATQRLISIVMPEEHQVVRCPHCRAKIVRPKMAPKAPGAARLASPPPAPAKRWKFCPFCGKPVDFEG